MALEKMRRWDDARTVAQRALGVQHDAAWEEDLRKRLTRFDAKASPENGSKQAKGSIPSFSIRVGATIVSLTAQTSLQPAPRNLALSSDGRQVLVSGGSSKGENLALVDVATLAPIWKVHVPGASAQVLTLPGKRYLAATDEGRVGEGSACLTWLDAFGHELHTLSLPDKLTQVSATPDSIVAGCRDGFLYVFDHQARLRWRYLTPVQQEHTVEASTQRPCPYFIQVNAKGNGILFSSYETAYLLDAAGKLRWSWEAASSKKRFTYTIPSDDLQTTSRRYRTLGLPASASLEDVRKAFRQRARETHPDLNPHNPRASDHFLEAVAAYEAILGRAASAGNVTFEILMDSGTTIYGLAVNDAADRVLVTSSDGSLTTLDGRGSPISRLVANEGPGFLAASPDLSRVVYAHWHGLNFYSSRGLVAVFPLEKLCQLILSPDGEHVAAWTGKTLLLMTTAGRLQANIEFAKSISTVTFLSNEEVLIAAGKLIRIECRWAT